MRKLISLLLVVAVTVIVFGIVGCSSTPEKPTITVSILPQKYFLEKIVKDKYNVTCLLAQGSNPEVYEPDMTHMMNLEKSVAFFKIGNIGFELAIADKVRNNNPELKFFNNSDGIDLIKGSHGVSVEHSHEVDPHVWTSVVNARVIAKNMLDAVCELDSNNAKFYKDNYKVLVDSLDMLNDSIERMLAPVRGCSFLVWHPSLSYFARDYGLHQISMEYEGKEITASFLKKRIDEARSDSAKVFFYQKEFDMRQTEVLTKEVEAELVPVNLLGYDWSAEMLHIANAIAKQ